MPTVNDKTLCYVMLPMLIDELRHTY